ncbi:hypothetical protein RMT89_37910 [Streptomyces sp. P17]|nr:hypothetical protein [Streptomyces sp. P17]MDT9701493.1 hypothetical protein [Streptomyces sp. P17]
MVDEPVDHGGGGAVAEDLSQRPKGLLVVITQARSSRPGMNWKNGLAASGSKGMQPTSSTMIRGMRLSRVNRVSGGLRGGSRGFGDAMGLVPQSP